jgi:hypothetical protein
LVPLEFLTKVIHKGTEYPRNTGSYDYDKRHCFELGEANGEFYLILPTPESVGTPQNTACKRLPFQTQLEIVGILQQQIDSSEDLTISEERYITEVINAHQELLRAVVDATKWPDLPQGRPLFNIDAIHFLPEVLKLNGFPCSRASSDYRLYLHITGEQAAIALRFHNEDAMIALK